VIRGPTVARYFIFGPTGPKRMYVNGEVLPVLAMKAYTSVLKGKGKGKGKGRLWVLQH